MKRKYLLTGNYWHPRVDLIIRKILFRYLCLYPVLPLHCNLFENRTCGVLEYDLEYVSPYKIIGISEIL